MTKRKLRPTPEFLFYQGNRYNVEELVKLAMIEYHNKLSANAVYKRIAYYGWDMERALTQKLASLETRHTGHHVNTVYYEYNGKKYDILQLLDIAYKKYHNDMSKSALYDRLHRRQMPIDAALKTPLRYNQHKKEEKTKYATTTAH